MVFREFQRLDQGAKVARGLALASRPGRGSIFRVEVAVVAATAPSVAQIEQPRAPAMPLAGLTVLAADNEPSILDGMRALLGGWGCEVVAVRSLEEARDAVANGAAPEVLIADYHLDQGDGLDAIATLRKEFLGDLPAILVTADRSPSVREAAAAANVPVFNKPLKPAALRALLAQWRATRVAAE